MKICFAVFLVGITFVWNGFSALAADVCNEWQCLAGLGGDANGTQRLCAKVDKTLASTEACEPEGKFLCNVEPGVTGQSNCSDANPLPWKSALAPGDTCEFPEQCQSGTCANTTAVCVGKGVNETCALDIDCAAGHSCNRGNSTCTPVVAKGANCTDDIKCGFGQACVNTTCQAYGSLSSASLFFMQDNELVADQTQDNSAAVAVACKTFVAVKTDQTDATANVPLYMCVDGYEPGFDAHGSDAARNCNFTLNYGNGTSTPGAVSFPATCGYNKDTKIYCPMRRSQKVHGTENSNDAKTWADAPSTCHIRSSVQYCKDIEGEPLRSLAFRSAMQTAWKTAGDNYPLIANSDRCIGNSIQKTRNFWRLVDSATGAVLSYFGLIASLFVLTLAY